MDKRSQQDNVKIFFALWPTPAGRANLAAWQPLLKKSCGGRDMRAATLHATLVFLGQLETSRLEALQLAAQEVGWERFDLTLDKARYWGHNHIVYAAPGRVPDKLRALVAALEQALRRHGFRFDQRQYKPHVTLLRDARWTDAALPRMEQVRWRVTDFALVQSAPEGYRILARFPFRPTGG